MAQRAETLPPEEPRERIAVTGGQKVNLGNYESADLSICLSGVPVGASEELIDAMLDTTKIVYTKIRERLKAEVVRLKTEVQNGRP